MATLALPGRGRREESELAVYLTVAVALAIGLFVQWSVVGRMNTVTAGRSTISYPASWDRVTEDGAVFAAADRRRGGLYGARVSLREVPTSELLPGQGTLDDAATNWSLARNADLVGYRILGMTQGLHDGREAMTIEYAYLESSPGGVADGTMPGLMHAIDSIVPSGETYQILTFAAESHDFPALTSRSPPRFRSVYQDIVTSWRVP